MFLAQAYMHTCTQSQLHTLWQAVEQQKRANADLKRRVETEEQTIELEKALEVQVRK